MTRIYRAYSARENYKNRDSVIVDWFCLSREGPVAPYDELILNYNDLSGGEKARARKLADNFLTEPEIAELKEYIESGTGFDVRISEVKTPFEDGRKIPDYAETAKTDADGDYFHLSEKQGYNLTVPISGFADLGEPPNIFSE
ncbi:MAG TPA: hypothetical protein ENI77_01105 [Nitrospirae bacterium]|nr:hypothetical protein [Nitrospirota bacterium]